MQGKVWLIGGTSDSAQIAEVLAVSGLPLVISVTTATAKALYVNTALVSVGCMDNLQMKEFCQQNGVRAIIDASHPYAVAVSSEAIAVADRLNLPYLRYERKNYQSKSASINPDVIELPSIEHLVAGDYLANQRILLTIGCKALAKFKIWHDRATLYARVLPKVASLKMAIAAGFTSDRLIAIRPPINAATETALWQQWRISLVVTKASGKAGGEDIKRQVAASLGIPLIVITRPRITYPNQTSEIKDILAFCRRAINFPN